MNVYDAAHRVWQEKLAAVGCAVLAVVIAIVATFHISFSPVSLHPRALQMGVAGESVLLDSEQSEISDAYRDSHRFGSLAATYTDLVDSRPITLPVARALHVAPDEIGVLTQITAQVPLSQKLPLEAQVGTEILATRRHFEITARNDSGTSIIQLYAQAPTGAQAVTMVTAAAHGLASYVSASARQGRVRKADRVVIRQIGTVYGRTLNHGVSRDAAILIGLATWILAFVGVLALKAQARRSRARPPRPALSES